MDEDGDRSVVLELDSSGVIGRLCPLVVASKWWW